MLKLILINSHKRSGTQFLIDSIRLNVKQAVFPVHKVPGRRSPKYLNIADLLFRKHAPVYDTFVKYMSQDKPVIIKNHCLPAEINPPDPRDRYEELAQKIFKKSFKLYIHRDGKDTLASLYRLLSPQTDFTGFLLTQNDYIPPVRDPGDADANRVRYWAFHVHSWSKEEAVQKVTFEDMKLAFDPALEKILDFIKEPVPAKCIRPKLPGTPMIHTLKKTMFKYFHSSAVQSTARKPGKGNIGDAKLHFTEDDIRFFERESSRGSQG